MTIVIPPRHGSTPPRVLTIAGSDSGAGAGIQADLKTFAALQCYGLSCITALTAQNTLGVQTVQGVETAMVLAQCQSVVEDIGIDSIKMGMLSSTETIQALANWLNTSFVSSCLPPIVLDPVCVSTSGHQLLPVAALASLKSDLLPLALIITPNIPEAELLCSSNEISSQSRFQIRTLSDMRTAAKTLGAMGTRYVYLKGGHLPFARTDDDLGSKYVVDLLWDSVEGVEVLSERDWYESKNTHGTGCTLSSAIAAYLARGESVPNAVRLAADYVALAIRTSYPLGQGSGPVNHFHSMGTRSLPLPSLLSPQPFTDFLISYAPETWSRYIHHPFPQALADGTCPLPAFLEFITQDYHFLIHYARTMSLMGYKSQNVEEMKATNEIVQVVLKETEMHINYCSTYNIPRSTLLSIPESVPNLAYNRYVLDTCSSSDLLTCRVVTSPCLIGYGVVGKALFESSQSVREESQNRYWNWIKEYGEGWYQQAVQTGIDLLEKTVSESPISCQRLIELAEVFKQASELEVAFWDAAWAARGDQEKWDRLRNLDRSDDS